MSEETELAEVVDDEDDEIDTAQPININERGRAYKLRKKRDMGATLRASEIEFLRAYDAEHPEKDFGGRASRKVTYSEEEHAAVGTGDAAKAAVESFGLAAMSREEGRRLDHILQHGINALVRACDLHEKMAAVLLRERMQDAEQNRVLMQSVRTHFLARAEAEAELIREPPKPEGDELNGIIAALMPVLMEQLQTKKKVAP